MKMFFSVVAMQFYLIAFVGMFAHALKKWVYKEIDGGLFSWYLTNKRYTVGVLMAVIGATAGGIGGGLYLNPADAAQVMACFLAAFGIDTLNKQ